MPSTITFTRPDMTIVWQQLPIDDIVPQEHCILSRLVALSSGATNTDTNIRNEEKERNLSYTHRQYMKWLITDRSTIVVFWVMIDTDWAIWNEDETTNG